jgi:hypothetical protein
VKARRNLVRAAWVSAASVLTVTVLAVATAAVSADEVGVQSVREFNGIATRSISPSYNPSGTPMLDHFYFRDVNDDQHIRHVSALPTLFGVVDISFEDASSGEQWEYRVALQDVSAAGLVPGEFSQRCYGRCTKELARPAGNYVFVISGFSFLFRGGDHHIDEIGVMENGGELVTYFNDQNDDDGYDVVVRYVWVPRALLSTVAAVSGTVEAAGSATRTVAAGNKVIRGFHVDNKNTGGSGDNHIKRFGFLTHSTSVAVYYGDRNPADSADWSFQFRYAVLA